MDIPKIESNCRHRLFCMLAQDWIKEHMVYPNNPTIKPPEIKDETWKRIPQKMGHPTRTNHAHSRLGKLTDSNMQQEIIQWLMHGENGVSSIAIAQTALKKPHQKYSHPTTPKSFRQCLLIIEQIPEAMQAVEELAKESKEWTSILAHWDELETTVRQRMGRTRQRSTRTRTQAVTNDDPTITETVKPRQKGTTHQQ